MKRITKSVSLAIATALVAVFLGACDPDDVRIVKAAELERMIAENPALLLIDNRSEFEFAYGRIPGAVNIPQEKFNLLPTLLPAAKDTPVVFYCRGYS